MPASPSSPPSPTALRMRRLRARRRAQGLVEQHRWVERDRVRRDPEPEWSDHRVAEIRSLAMHALIAQKLVHDPGVIRHALGNLDRWEASRGAAPGWAAEWRRILALPPERIAAFLVSTSEDAFRLRQSSPFAGVLGVRERRALFDAFRRAS